MNAPAIAKTLASEVRGDPAYVDSRSTFDVIGPVNADSTSFVLIGTYVGDDKPSAVYRVTVEKIH